MRNRQVLFKGKVNIILTKKKKKRVGSKKNNKITKVTWILLEMTGTMNQEVWCLQLYHKCERCTYRKYISPLCPRIEPDIGRWRREKKIEDFVTGQNNAISRYTLFI